MRQLSENLIKAVIEYTYQNWAAPASGERALTAILMPGAYAREPLENWLLPPVKCFDAHQFDERNAESDTIESAIEFCTTTGSKHSEAPATEEKLRLLKRTASIYQQKRIEIGNISNLHNDSCDPILGGGGVQCPVLFIYGSPKYDWMESKYGKQLVDKLTNRGIDAQLIELNNSGHLLFLDEPTEFVKAIISI